MAMRIRHSRVLRGTDILLFAGPNLSGDELNMALGLGIRNCLPRNISRKALQGVATKLLDVSR